MKPSFLIALCVLVAALAGAGTSYLMVESQSDLDSIEENRDLQQAMTQSQQRVFDLEGKVLLLEQARQQSPALDPLALKDLDDKYRQEIASLRSAMAKLEKSRPLGGVPEEMLANASGTTIEDVLNRQVAKAMEKSNAERRKAERKRWTPFVKAQMTRQLKRTMKKLKLRPDQAERFEASINESMEAVMPAMGIVMDPQAKKEEKAEAFTQINSAMENVDNDAKAYMDPQQYTTFSEEQSRQRQQMTQMQAMFGGGNGGGAPGNNGGNGPN